ncbi:hypothetical protein BURK1_00408 [Burkholderiales bacterium]|nr:hypothetical protein BURK1_00408 [Burkholderiales bacterium]
MTADFSFHARANGDVAIRRGARIVTVLRGRRASEFLARMLAVSPGERQLAMARVTGNYRRGNERAAVDHPRNTGPG